MGTVDGYDLPYFSKDKILTKSHIIKQYSNDHELAQYLPEWVNPSTITLEFLLHYCTISKWRNIYCFIILIKKRKKQSSTTGGKIYKIGVGNEFIGQLRNYTSTIK